MDLVDTDRSEARLSLLQQLGDGEYDEIGPFWYDLLLEWDGGEHPYDAIRKGVEKYQAHTSKTAAEETEAILLGQLREVLAYDHEKLQLKSKKIEVLYAIIQDFKMHHRKATKSRITRKRLENACSIVRAMCQCYPRMAFEPCPDSRKRGSFLQSAFQFAVASNSEDMLQIMLDELMDSFGTDGIIDSESKSQPQQPQQIICHAKETVEENIKFVELLINISASLPHDIESKVMDIIDKMVGKNTSLLNKRTWEIIVTTPLPNFALRLLKSRNSVFLTEEHATFVAEKGTVSMWQMFPEQVRRASISAQDFGLLRKIISSRKVDMAKTIFELDAAFIDASIEAEGYEILLQHLKDIKKDSAVENTNGIVGTIRDLLVGSMIRSRNLGVQDMRDILRRLESTSKLRRLPTCRCSVLMTICTFLKWKVSSIHDEPLSADKPN